MDEIRIRNSIPAAWAEQGRCPICSAPKMQLRQQAGVPDQLQCAACGTAFEVEQDGPRLHMTALPAALAPCRETTAGRWLTVAELRALVAPGLRAQAATAPKSKAARPEAGPSIPKPISAVDTQALAVRIKNLRELGNGPTQIRLILSRDGIPGGQMEAGLKLAEQMKRQEQDEQVKKLGRSLGLVAVVVIVFIAAVLLIRKAYAGRNEQAGEPNQASMVSSVLEVLKIETPVVQQNAAPPASSSGIPGVCPGTAAEAAALFGGAAEAWSSPAGSNGWVLINTTQATIIYVPAGMTAAYLQIGEQLGLSEVHGPASMQNVSYVAISCQ